MLLRLNKSKWVRNIYKPIVEVSKKTLHAPIHNVQYSQLSINRGPPINGGGMLQIAVLKLCPKCGGMY